MLCIEFYCDTWYQITQALAMKFEYERYGNMANSIKILQIISCLNLLHIAVYPIA